MDATDAELLPEAAAELSTIAADEQLMGVPIVIAANKQDSAKAISMEDLHRALAVDQCVASIGMRSGRVHCHTSIVSCLLCNVFAGRVAVGRDCLLQPMSTARAEGVHETLNFLADHMQPL